MIIAHLKITNAMHQDILIIAEDYKQIHEYAEPFIDYSILELTPNKHIDLSNYDYLFICKNQTFLLP